MHICYSFSTFTHVTCTLSVFTIFSLRWEVHLYSNIFTLYSIYSSYYPFYRLSYTITLDLTDKSEKLGLFVFARHYLQNLYWFLFHLLLRYFNSQSFSFLEVSLLGYSSFISCQSGLFVLFYVLLVNPLVILQIPLYTSPLLLGQLGRPK
jgi:hypothetical protein